MRSVGRRESETLSEIEDNFLRAGAGASSQLVSDGGVDVDAIEISGGHRTRSSVPPNLAAGMRIAGKYELVRKVGCGAMGEVWAAKHISLGEEVAIKIVLREIMHEDGSSTDSRFLLEARVSAQLSRKTRHIVSVTDHGEHGPYAYLVMDLLKGESLDTRLGRSGPLSVAKVVPLIYQVARAISVAHADGVVHRDLKPSNIFVTSDEDGRALIKILDFGIAKMRPLASLRRIPTNAQHAQDVAQPPNLHSKDKHITLSGFLLGTPEYMSPEQARGKSIDHRADVWALAVIAYHLLTEHFPFGGETIEDLFLRLHCVDATPISSYRPELSPRVGELFARAFSPRIDQRFQSAVSFARALEQVETLAAGRAENGTPAPMVKISLPPTPLVILGNADDEPVFLTPLPPLPPPARVPTIAKEPPLEKPKSIKDTGALIPAGVPQREGLLRRAIIAVAALAIVGITGSLISVYYEREPGHARALSTSTPTEARERDEIPAPPTINSPTEHEAAPVTTNKSQRIQDLPTALMPVTMPVAASPHSQTAALPTEPSPPASAPTPAPSKRYDRSEVF